MWARPNGEPRATAPDATAPDGTGTQAAAGGGRNGEAMKVIEFGRSNDGEWLSYVFQTTWPYGWEFVLEACQVLIDRDLVRADRLFYGRMDERGPDHSAELEAVNGQIRATGAAQESAFLILGGYSRLMQCPLSLQFNNQTDVLMLTTYVEEVPEEVRERPDAFTTYVSSIELNAYISMTRKGLI